MINDFFILLTAALVAICCALLGTFLVLRKMALVGDAVSHAVLPGIVIAYFITGEKNSPLLLIGATMSGIAATAFIDFFARRARIQGDASIGITYTLLFAVGMILIAWLMQGNADIDQDCVLYGDIALINLDKIIIDGNLYVGPRALYVELVALIIVVTSIVFGFKGFKLLSFNEDFAKTLGMSTTAWHYWLMALLSLTAVVSFEVVGAVLVVGFLVIPPATAKLIAQSLNRMLLLSAVFGVCSVFIGYFVAVWLDVSITGCMVCAAGLLFALVFALTSLWRSNAPASKGSDTYNEVVS